MPLKLSISSKSGYFEITSIAKSLKPGFKTIFSVQPIQVVATPDLKEVSQKARKCKFPHEMDSQNGVFKRYSHSSCSYECRIKFAKNFCQCIPWNFASLSINDTICDLNGNDCFHKQMMNMESMNFCSNLTQCPLDCETVRFTITEKEFPIDPEEFCATFDGDLFARAYLL